MYDIYIYHHLLYPNAPISKACGVRDSQAFSSGECEFGQTKIKSFEENICKFVSNMCVSSPTCEYT